jgi:hypothetical protein
MTQRTIEEIVEEIDKQIVCDELTHNSLRRLIKTALETERRQTAKAYGGCTDCYGKGYSTQQVGEVRGGGMTFDVPKKVINFCKCDRGAQLKELFKQERRQADERLREVVGEILKELTSPICDVESGECTNVVTYQAVEYNIKKIAAKYNIDITPNTPSHEKRT